MNQKLNDVFKGKDVNKALTIHTGVDEFPPTWREWRTRSVRPAPLCPPLPPVKNSETRDVDPSLRSGTQSAHPNPPPFFLLLCIRMNKPHSNRP
jgi:hypothetical protein